MTMTILLNKAYKLLSAFNKSTINMNNLHMCDFGRMEKQHVSFQIALPRIFFPASLAPISGCILVDVSDMFVQTTLTCVCTGTAWTREALANVFSPGVIGQRAGVIKR